MSTGQRVRIHDPSASGVDPRVFRGAGLFDPVWVRGELKADDNAERLYLMGGASDVSVSDAMDAEAVWLY